MSKTFVSPFHSKKFFKTAELSNTITETSNIFNELSNFSNNNKNPNYEKLEDQISMENELLKEKLDRGCQKLEIFKNTPASDFLINGTTLYQKTTKVSSNKE